MMLKEHILCMTSCSLLVAYNEATIINQTQGTSVESRNIICFQYYVNPLLQEEYGKLYYHDSGSAVKKYQFDLLQLLCKFICILR